jgi:hypothetical protein
MIEGVPEGPWQYTKDKIGDEHWPVICMTGSGRIGNSSPMAEGDVLAALANLRDQTDKLKKRVDRLESEERASRR